MNMKCLIISSNRWNSAITEYALSLGKALSLRHFNVSLVLLAHSPAVKRARESGLFAYELSNFGLVSRQKVRDILKLEKPSHVIVCGGPEDALVAFLPGDFKRIRFRGQDFRHRNWFRFFLLGLQSRRLDGILYPSEYLLNKDRTVHQLQSKAIVLGIDTSRFHPVPSSYKNGELIIFGRLDPVKGHRSFIQTYAEARRLTSGQSFPVLHIVGQPANVSATDIQEWVKEVGLKFGEDVRLTSERIKDPKQLMSDALMGVISSLGSELICRVAEEFLLCGAPIFVSGAGSLNEVLFPNAGWSYFKQNRSATAAQLHKAVISAQNEKLADRQKRADQAKAFFSLESMGVQAEEFLRGLC